MPLLSLKFGDDSGYQNTSEFLAATIGILTCLRIAESAGSHIVIDLRGNSVSALQWANTSRFNSESVHRAAILFTHTAPSEPEGGDRGRRARSGGK